MRPRRTYSATVIHGGVDGSCGTTATSRASSPRGRSALGRPSSRISPANGSEPRDRPEERRLPRAVRADEREPLAVGDVRIDAIDDRPTAELDRDAAQLDHACASSRRAQDEREERRAEEGGHDAERDLPRSDRRARDDVREDEEARADDHRERDQRAVADPGEQSDRVRDDDPDEADEPGDRDRGRRPERRGDDEREPDAAHVDAEARRLVVAEIEDVHDAPERDDHDDRHGDVRENQDDVRPAGARDVPEDPRVDLLERLRVLLLHERLPRREERGHRDAGEDQRRRVALPPCRAADGVGEHHRDRSADERRDRKHALSAQPVGQVRDRDRRAEAGAGRDAEEVRIRERIAEDALVRRARDREHRADERREDDPRHADLPEDRLLGRRERRREAGDVEACRRRLEHGADAEVDRPDEHADRERHEQERDRGARPGRRSGRGREPRRRAPLRPTRRYWRSRARAAETARKKFTIRGPQREAIESSMRTIDPLRTALTRSQPGRAATVDAF